MIFSQQIRYEIVWKDESDDCGDDREDDESCEESGDDRGDGGGNNDITVWDSRSSPCSNGQVEIKHGLLYLFMHQLVFFFLLLLNLPDRCI